MMKYTHKNGIDLIQGNNSNKLNRIINGSPVGLDAVLDGLKPKSKLKKAISEIMYWVAGPILALSTSQAQASIDPLTLVNSSYTYERAIPNPHSLDNWGKIKGLDAIKNGTEVIALWDSGHAAVYNADMTTELRTMGFSGNTGICEIPTTLFGKGANLVTTRSSGILDFYDYAGNPLGSMGISLSGINDITYDVGRNRLIVSAAGTWVVNANGTATNISASSPAGIEALTLGKDGLGNEIGDMLQLGQIFSSISDNGTFINSKVTNLREPTQGYGYTNLKTIDAVENGFYVYDKMAFQDYIQRVPEPCSLALLALGGMILRGRKQ